MWTIQWHLDWHVNAFTVLCNHHLCLVPKYFHHSKVKSLTHLAVSPHCILPPGSGNHQSLCLHGSSILGISHKRNQTVFLSLGMLFSWFIHASFPCWPCSWVLSTHRQSYCTFFWAPLAAHLSTHDLFSFLKDEIRFAQQDLLFPIRENPYT